MVPILATLYLESRRHRVRQARAVQIVGIATTGPDNGNVALFNAAGAIDAALDAAGRFQ
jgi:hypothetical protein